MRTKHVVSNSNINLPLGPSVNNITQLLSRKRFNGLVIIMIEPSTSFSGHTHKIHYQLQAIASSFRLNFVSPIFYIIPRSEERRVGKECRSRWSRDHSK